MTVRMMFACIMALAPLVGCSVAEDSTPQNLPRKELCVGEHVVNVQVADTDTSRSKGLMFVTNMPDSEGMLFVWPDAEIRSFWMRNTYIPLDLLFVRDSRVVGIAAWAKPHDESQILSDGPADSVVEVNGGWAARHGIAVGSPVMLVEER